MVLIDMKKERVYVFVHGFGSTSCDGEFNIPSPSFANALQSQKFGTIINIDFIETEQEAEISTLLKFFLQYNLGNKKKEIVLICASHGALIVSLFLDRYINFQKNIIKIIAWYPCLQYENIFYQKTQNGLMYCIPGSSELTMQMQLSFENGKSYNPWGEFFISKRFYQNIEMYRSQFFETTTIPTLFFHGEIDSVVPIVYSEAVAKKNSQFVQLICILKAGHSFEERRCKDFIIRQSLQFLV